MSKLTKNPNEMDASEHLKELKHRVFCVVAIFIILFVVGYTHCKDLLDVVTKLGNEVGYDLVYLSPQEVLIQQIRLAGVFSLMCTIPVIIYEAASFVAPAFEDKHALLKIIGLGIIATVLFILGVIFAYKVLLPLVYNFLYGIGTDSNIKAQVSIEKYISLFITTVICIGTVTEMPLICIILTKAGLLTTDIMKRIRPMVIVGIFLVAAIITPPDVVSQILVALPMVGLYQVSIIFCKFIK